MNWLPVSLGLGALVLSAVSRLHEDTYRGQQGLNQSIQFVSGNSATSEPLIQAKALVRDFGGPSRGAQPLLNAFPEVNQSSGQPPAWMHLDPEGAAQALFTKLRSETRDDSWAQFAEGNITSLVTKAVLGKGTELEEVQCRRSVCEVDGSAESGGSPSDTVAAWQALQAQDLQSALKAQGLNSGPSIFSSNAGNPKFTMFFSRE